MSYVSKSSLINRLEDECLRIITEKQLDTRTGLVEIPFERIREIILDAKEEEVERVVRTQLIRTPLTFSCMVCGFTANKNAYFGCFNFRGGSFKIQYCPVCGALIESSKPIEDCKVLIDEEY